MNFNQLTIVGYIGNNAETHQLTNGTPVTKFSVATTRSWKDDEGEWKNKTQWHDVVAFGQGFAQLAAPLAKAHTFSCRVNYPPANTIALPRCLAGRRP